MLFYIISWFGLLVLAIMNAVVRDATYGKVVSELRAHQLSTLTGVIVMAAATAAICYFRPLSSLAQALAVGLAWTGMTVVFEFLFGHYVLKLSWKRLLADYNVAKGRVWSLFLLVLTLLPALAYLLMTPAR